MPFAANRQYKSCVLTGFMDELAGSAMEVPPLVKCSFFESKVTTTAVHGRQ